MKKYLLKLSLVLILASGIAFSAFAQSMAVPVNLGQDTAVCFNDSLLLDATFPNCTYLWSTGSTNATITVNTFPGTYSVTVTDTTGVYTPGSDTIATTGLNIPPVGINPSGTVMLPIGDSVLLTGSFGGSSVWFRNGMALSGPHTNEYWVKTPGLYNMTKTNLNGCTDSAAVGTVVVEGTVSSDPLGNAAVEVRVFPNPATQFLNVQIVGQGKHRFELYSLTGLNLSTAIMSPNLQFLDMSSLPKGLYFYRISKGKSMVDQGKLILE